MSVRRASRTLLVLASLGLAAATGCTTYYYERSLNTLPTGMTKAEFLRRFQGGGLRSGAILRASRSSSDGLIEVATLDLSPDGLNHEVQYWFVFKNGRLMQWGRPEDWRNVAATYQVDFNPKVGVHAP